MLRTLRNCVGPYKIVPGREVETETNDNSGPGSAAERGASELDKPGLNFVPSTEPAAGGPGFLGSTEPWPVLVRVLLFVILMVGFSATLGTLAALAGLITPGDLTKGLFYSELTKAIGTLLAAWVMSLLEGRKLGEYGLPWGSGQGKFFLTGAVFGIAEIAAIVGVLAAAGYYSFGSLEVHGAILLKWALFWAAVFVVVGFFEEYAFRGYLQFALTKGFGFWTATIVTSLIFGLVHLANQGESWPGIAGVMAVGLFWCFTLRRTGSLWFAFGMHAAFDFGETFLFSVPDSGIVFPGHLSSALIHNGPVWLVGGTAGPEASVLDFVILGIFFFIVHVLYPVKPDLLDLLPAGSKFGVMVVEDGRIVYAAPLDAEPSDDENQRTSSDA